MKTCMALHQGSQQLLPPLVTRSLKPSRLISLVLRSEEDTDEMACANTVKLPAPLPANTRTTPFCTTVGSPSSSQQPMKARSAFPSPLKSPVLIARTNDNVLPPADPGELSYWETSISLPEKLPCPSPKRIEMVLLFPL